MEVSVIGEVVSFLYYRDANPIIEVQYLTKTDNGTTRTELTSKYFLLKLQFFVPIPTNPFFPTYIGFGADNNMECTCNSILTGFGTCYSGPSVTDAGKRTQLTISITKGNLEIYKTPLSISAV